MTDLFSYQPPKPKQPAKSNVPDFSVSELAFSLKRTIEENYGRVRVRGELSRVSIPKSGHMYTALKDDNSVIDAVCWKGVLNKLSIRPEEGLEVICTGKITTYPARSNYQLVIESMELAGEGALLKMLEERRKRLQAEGLFAPERKKNLPFLPKRIGVVTSPTGAVIRDILHRLSDRFPRHVVVWPVKVQGDGAANEVTNAINGFNQMPEGQRPDLLIVARGGGSLEDLMPFNEENVVRAAAASRIPIISAVGHETDTTLIDYAADLRAPTPTGAAEKAVPVRIELMAGIKEFDQRLLHGLKRKLSEHHHRLEALTAKLGNPDHLLEYKTQHLDTTVQRLDDYTKRLTDKKLHALESQLARLTHPAQLIQNKHVSLTHIAGRIESAYTQFTMRKTSAFERSASLLRAPKALIMQSEAKLERSNTALYQHGKNLIKDQERKLTQLSEKLELLSFENVLKRGYVVVRDLDTGKVLTKAENAENAEKIGLQFQEGGHVKVRVDR